MRVGEGPLLTTYIKGRTLTNAEMAEKQKVAERRRKHPGTGITSSAPVTPVVEHETQSVSMLSDLLLYLDFSSFIRLYIYNSLEFELAIQ